MSHEGLIQPKTPVEALLETVVGPPTAVDLTLKNQLQDDIACKKGLIGRLRRFDLGSMLPPERPRMNELIESNIYSSNDVIEEKRKEIEKESFIIKCQQKHMDVARKGYPFLLDMNLLGLSQGYYQPSRKDEKRPVFVVTPVNNSSGECFISHQVGTHTEFKPKLPKSISHCLEKSLDGVVYQGITIKGVAPIEARDAINAANHSRAFDQIFLIAEVRDWQARVADSEVIVGGYVEETKQLFLITHYTMTPPIEHLRHAIS